MLPVQTNRNVTSDILCKSGCEYTPSRSTSIPCLPTRATVLLCLVFAGPAVQDHVHVLGQLRKHLIRVGGGRLAGTIRTRGHDRVH